MDPRTPAAGTSPRRDHMLAAAAHRFAHEPFHQVDMDSIAREAGVGKGTLYRYFAGKDELFLATLEWQVEDALDWIHRAGAEAPDPLDYLRVVVDASVDYFLARPDAFHLVLLAHGSQQTEVAGVLERVRARHHPGFRRRLEEAAAAGRLAGCDADLLVRWLDAGVVQLLAWSLEGAADGASAVAAGQRVKEGLAMLLLNGLLPREPLGGGA